MKKLMFASATAVALMVALTGCITVVAPKDAGASTPDPSVSAPAYTPPAPEAHTPTAAETFDARVENRMGPGTAAPAERLAQTVCAALDAGASFREVALVLVQSATESGVDPSDVGFIVGEGVPAFCPQYEGDMAAFLAANA